jgi:prolyl oligopeptidase
MRISLRAQVGVLLLTAAAQAQGPSFPAPPATPKRPVTDEYQSVKVTDDYHWLENWDDPATKHWSAAENDRIRKYLDQLPARPSIKEQIRQLISGGSASYCDLQFRGGMLFAMKYQPPRQQPMLVVLHSADDPSGAKVIFDPNSASSMGSTSVDF